MQPTRHLAKLKGAATRRALYLRYLADSCTLPITPQHDRLVAFLTIEALNLWSCFCRTYYLSCVLNAKTVQGGRITVGNVAVRTVDEATEHAVRKFKPWLKGPGPFERRDEPPWHDPTVLLRLVTDLKCSALAQVTIALGQPSTAFSDLPVFRNFFAHRNEDTARKTANIARRYSLNPALRPSARRANTR